MSEIAARLAAVRARVAAAAIASGRDASSVRLLAVSKTAPTSAVLEAAAAGQRWFGENRVQEAAEKIRAVRAAGVTSLEWHLIGQLQRNKARLAVELFDVIHSVDRPELAEALARHARELGRRPRVLVQVDLDDEAAKGGVSASEAPALIRRVASLESLELVGLMAIPRPHPEPEQMRPAFARLRGLAEAVTLAGGTQPSELSMGMSGDFEVAIQEGATWVRIGTAIFGERAAPPNSASQTDTGEVT